MADWSFQIEETKRKKKHYAFPDLIVYEDDQLIGINKPSGIPSIAERQEGNVNLLEMGRAYYSDLFICHRLDKMTSGILLFAKGQDNFRNIALQFQNREVKKHYKALVQGIHNFEDLTLDAPLAFLDDKARVHKGEGKPAQTIFNSEEYFSQHTLVDCQPITGRTHQIRAHLAHLGAPIVGDELYGGKDLYLSSLKRKYVHSKFEEERPLNHGYLLQALNITINDPKTGEPRTLEAPYAKDFEVCLKMLRKFKR